MLEVRSRAYRWLRAAWTIFYGLRQHARQKGADLPSLPRRIVEQARLLILSGITPTNYYRFRLYRRDMPAARKAMFIGFFEGWRWQDAVNDPEFAIVVFDKYVFSQLLHSWEIPQPRCLGVFGLPDGAAGQSCAAKLAPEFRRFLAEQQPEQFFLKPVSGRGGTGSFSVGRRFDGGRQWELPPQGERVTLDDLVQRVAGQDVPFMAQERLFPHPDLGRAFGAEVLHTIRVMTVLDGDVKVAHATLKIGLGVLPVDNTMKGNAIAGIDVASGVVGPARVFRDLQGMTAPELLERHPLTGIRFEGQQIPQWEEALAMVKQAAARFYPLALLAWDIAITTRGPVVVEANTRANIALTQLANDEGLLLTPLGDYLYRRGDLKKLGVGIGLTEIYEGARWGAPARPADDAAGA